MKKLSFLLVAFALVSFVSLNSCKSSTQPEAEAATEVVVEEAPADEVVDSAAVTTEATTEAAAE